MISLIRPILVALAVVGFAAAITHATDAPGQRSHLVAETTGKTTAPLGTLALNAGGASKLTTSILHVGERRPNFKLRDLEGNYRDISEWDGKLVFLNFWATWCPPCVHEIPTFSNLQKKYADVEVQFLGVALDHPQDVKRFIKEYGMQYPTLYGEKDALDLSKIYGNKYGGLPYTVVIGRDGVVLHTHSGVLNRELAEQLIRNAA